MPTLLPLPGVDALVAERTALLETLRSLDRDDLLHGPTLCAGWSPRDVLAHLVGTEDGLLGYVRAGGSIPSGNVRAVEQGRRRDVDDLLARGDRFASAPSLAHQLAAWPLLGDTAVHHLDVLRPRGIARDLPDASAAAVFREGLLLGAARLREVRVVPTDVGRPVGWGREVSGPRVALGMWLTGRDGFEEQLAGLATSDPQG